MGRLTIEGKKLVYPDKNYNISSMKKHMFSSMKNVADYVIENKNAGNEFDKVIFVVRHSIRPRDDWSNTVKLTPLGVHGAERAGKSLCNLPGEMSYYSTNTTRTRETAYYMSTGRHIEYLPSPADVKDIYSVGTDLNYIKDQKQYDYLLKLKGYNATWYEYMYEEAGTDTAFNNIETVSMDFIRSVIEKTDTQNNILVSHDQNVMPLVVYSLNKLIDFRINNSWLNYLSGIAILQKGNVISIIPTTGLITGYN